MNNKIQRLIEAIRNSELIEINYKGIDYLVEAYLLYEGKNSTVYLHGWKLSGSDYIKNPGSHFANFIVDEINSIKKFANFTAPLVGYKPNSKMFYKVLYKWNQK